MRIPKIIFGSQLRIKIENDSEKNTTDEDATTENLSAVWSLFPFTLTGLADGHLILSAIYNAATPQKLQKLSSVEILRQVWVQQYAFVAESLVWRQKKSTGVPPNKLSIESQMRPGGAQLHEKRYKLDGL